MQRIVLAVAFLVVPHAAMAEGEHRSPYAGMQVREIKSFSNEDLAQLRAGHGWGLSLVAELNGVPGPRHVLELQRELGLSKRQIVAIQAVYDRMKEAAVPLGVKLIRLEAQLDRSFAGGAIDSESLQEQLATIAIVRRDLRFTHLAAHLATPNILSAEQVRLYTTLRGYGDDPCSSVPPGHDPVMWRKHNGCE